MMPTVVVEVESKFKASDAITKVGKWIRGVVYIIGGNKLVSELIYIENIGDGGDETTVGEAIGNGLTNTVGGWSVECEMRMERGGKGR